ncbi:hypothetical protein GCM10011378_40750 [Hymenobacter glacieicola]|uniref:Uncharacterized protein n=1 Tax=Hymenobacter glacieicola TaxID=1562124 RepID=A0ABQ1X7W4_9BACT|nr:hypothetical protein GCM10011378_40750 [Hymenobacter glacieicola]
MYYCCGLKTHNMIQEATDTRQVKAAYCQHCQGWIRVAAFPWCEDSKEARKEFKQHIKDGNRIALLLLTEWNEAETPFCSC